MVQVPCGRGAGLLYAQAHKRVFQLGYPLPAPFDSNGDGVFFHIEIIRSRDEELLKTLDILVDVGAEYDPARLRFDHHQRGFATTFSPKHTIKLSSAGLIYLHYGKEVIQSIVQLPIDHPNMETVFQKVYTVRVRVIATRGAPLTHP